MIQKKSILAVFCAAALISTGGAFSSMAEPSSDLRIYGPVTENSGSRLTLDNQSTNSATGEMVIHIAEDTKILNAVTGMPEAADQIASGETVYAYISQVMTMSIPPQTTADLILTDIPADYKIPDYIEVASMDAVDGGYRLTAADGLTFQVPSDCPITPYLTRNMLYLENLYSGARCLVWSDTNGTASQIMMFQPYSSGEGESSETTQAAQQTGWVLTGGEAGTETAQWIYYNADGTLAKGWIEDGGNWYFLNLDTGIMERSCFIQVDGKTYYMQADGTMLTEARTFTPAADGSLS
ncbi:MAG TPA: hypothetical protein IAA17_01100 [Candidatus Lachnoclostridium stercorigallinarum]|uniref:Cell wall binding repeat-containing protein n=1 Tax=Candidatus Lachnoclostridium stercorigallinarum TaxID=2838634 RepID=A0A9D2GGA4_9FIRM|nr:hypothetical protein [Candidatus Lachnoclostridium stercorigallinarum]